MKSILTFALTLISTVSLAQDWSDWLDVGHGIQVSFKYGKEPCTFANTRAKMRNTSLNTYKQVKVSFDKNCVNQGTASVDAYDFASNQVKESPGDVYVTSLQVKNVRLIKLTDENYRDLLGSTAPNLLRGRNIRGSGISDSNNVINLVAKQGFLIKMP